MENTNLEGTNQAPVKETLPEKEVKIPSPKKTVKPPVIKEKSGYDIFNRTVELKGLSVKVAGLGTKHKSEKAAGIAYAEALNKTVW